MTSHASTGQRATTDSVATDSDWWLSLPEADRRRLDDDRATFEEIAALGPEIARRSDESLRERAAELRRSVQSGVEPDEILSEWFALTREVADRVLGERPYPAQLVAGIVLSRGELAEMKTGEGKTLAAVAPVSFAALTGNGVHVLTFNDYLARRDAEWMGPVYAWLGLSVGAVVEGMSADERRQAYSADVTYLTVKEAGFDLLRDGLCLEAEAQVHRPLNVALVDEADSILIDEARIPLVIAGTVEDPASDLRELAAVGRRLTRDVDFSTDEEQRNIFLTETGVRHVESLLGCGNLFDPENLKLQAEVRNALHAQELLHRNVDYIVRNGRIEIVDELTGRVADKRHWPDGLQAALEAKEGLDLQPEGRILGSITVQHFVHRYRRLSAMTATAESAAIELREIYDLEVVAIPTHLPSIRVDHSDVIFTTAAAKRRALIDEISREHARGRPILVGTVSVEESESLAQELVGSGIDCRVLNARNDAEEAEIVAEAGGLGAVTISTNMAGRGTDIRLGGSAEAGRDAVLALGGLYVIGTNRHESRRIDDQLRGRAGRQGDPGSSRFLISLEDDLLERCGIRRLVPTKLLPEEGTDEPVDHSAIRREVDRAQRIMEGQHGDIRSQLLRYTDLVEGQREHFQEERRAVLGGLAESRVLGARSPERWRQLSGAYGSTLLLEIERRLTLLTMDRFWRDHLDRTSKLRDEIHLVQFDGRQPVVEFYRTTGSAYESMSSRIDAEIAEAFERIRVTGDGVDWDAEGLRGPSSTWTYLVSDSVFGENTFLALANRPSLGLWAVLTCWWLLLPWAFVIHWRRWRSRSRETASPTRSDSSPKPN